MLFTSGYNATLLSSLPKQKCQRPSDLSLHLHQLACYNAIAYAHTCKTACCRWSLFFWRTLREALSCRDRLGWFLAWAPCHDDTNKWNKRLCISKQVRGFCVQSPCQWFATASLLDCHCYKVRQSEQTHTQIKLHTCSHKSLRQVNYPHPTYNLMLFHSVKR